VIENAYLLENAERFSLHILFYEDLIDDASLKIQRICQILGIEASNHLDREVAKSSHTAHPRSPLFAPQEGYSGWTKRLSAKNIRKITRIMEIAGVRYPY
jgi:hypothetical protein